MTSYVFFDFETTGFVLPSTAAVTSQPRAIELAMVKTDAELNVIDEYERMFYPAEFVTPEITKITGITNEMVADQKPFAARYREVSAFMLGTTHLVAHNLAFDLNVLVYELSRIGKQYAFPYPPNHICTASMTEQKWGTRATLKATHEKLFGEKYNQLHRALDDTRLLLKVYKELNR